MCGHPSSMLSSAVMVFLSAQYSRTSRSVLREIAQNSRAEAIGVRSKRGSFKRCSRGRWTETFEAQSGCYACRSLLDQLSVEANGLVRDGIPAKELFDAQSSCISKAPALFRVLKQSTDPRSKVSRKPFGILGKACDGIRIERN